MLFNSQPYQISCSYTASGLTATSFSKRQCSVTPSGGGAATTLNFAGGSPYTSDTVKSGPVFAAGTYTTDVSIMYTDMGTSDQSSSTGTVTWDDSASQTAVVSSSATSATTSHTMSNSGVSFDTNYFLFSKLSFDLFSHTN